MSNKIGNKIGRWLWYLLISAFSCAAAAVIMVCKWAKETFAVGLNAIINTLFSPLKGTSSDTILPAVKYCLPVVLLALFICIIYIFWDRKYGNKIVRGIATLAAAGSVIAAFSYVQLSYDVLGYIRSSNQETNFYKENYVSPNEVAITSPEKKRNLIYIYLESMETTYADVAAGGKQEVNYMPYCTQMADAHISFSNTEKFGGLQSIMGATWTMGALFTSSSGLPFAIPVGSNDMSGQTAFASGTYTMGDFLKEQGYVQEFLCGSDAVFAGRKVFYEQHGAYEIFDLYTARERGYIPKDYYEWWGFEDKILYEIAKEELLRLSAQEQPFNLTMLTADAHHIGGYLCDLCEETYEDVTANVITCADKQLYEFITWCKQQDFFEDTTIVLVGDHRRMDTHLVEGIKDEERTLFNCFINAVHKETVNNKNRGASMLDMYPTVLSALGYQIEGEQLGLGVNLFSEKETLQEKYGLQTLNEEFVKRSAYYVERFTPEMAYLVADEEDSICTISFSEADYNASEYVKEGISKPEKTFSWVEGQKMTVSIPIKEDLEQVRVTIHVIGSVRDEYYNIKQGEKELCNAVLGSAGLIAFDAAVEDGRCEFELNVPFVESPFAYGMGEDTRPISFKLSHITINRCEE